MAAPSDLQIRPGTPDDLPVLRELFRELLTVLATYNPKVDPANELQSDWVEKPGKLFAWVFEQREHTGEMVTVGMALVCGKAYTEAIGETTDLWLYEYVITEKHRRTGLGKAALAQVLDAHEGEWCVYVLPDNRPAMGFWKGALAPFNPRTSMTKDDMDVEFKRFVFTTGAAQA